MYMKEFKAMIESHMNGNLKPIEEMAVRAGTERKSFITRWDNASWESFYGDFDKMKSNSKKYTTKNEARIAAIALAQKKVDAKKSKIMVDDALTGQKIWSPGDMKLSPGEQSQIAKKPVAPRDPNVVKRSKDAPVEEETNKIYPFINVPSEIQDDEDKILIAGIDPKYFKNDIEFRRKFGGAGNNGIFTYTGSDKLWKIIAKNEDIMRAWLDAYKDEITFDKSSPVKEDNKAWTIYHSVTDYEHEGDIGRERREIVTALKNAGISEKDVSWDREVEHADGSNGDGSATILIHGKGSVFKKKVQDAIDSHF